ncbi:MAG: hypothetical protein ACI3ZE_03845 [Candidatus Woodwardiibium sp.]
MKKTLSVLLAALLLCSLCVIFAAAEDVNPDGYAFKVDTVNIAVAGEKTTIITKQDLIPSANMKWSVNIVLDKVADGLYKAAGDAVPGSGSDPDITLEEGQIILAVHSSTSDPAQIDEYPNVYGKLNAAAIKAGMFIQLSGVDLTVDGAVENGTATCTVEDPRTADTSTGTSEAEPSEAESSAAESTEAPASSAAESSKTPETSDAGITALIVVALAALAVTVTVIRKRS